MRRLSVLCMAVAGVLAVAAPAKAANIVGTIGFGGGVVYDTRGAGTGLAIIDFTPLGAGNGNTAVIKDATGYFAGGGSPNLPGNGVDTFSTAKILDLTNDATAAGVPPAGPGYCPGGTCPGIAGIGVGGFLNTFADADAAGLHFDMTALLMQPGSPCTGTETVGQTCTEGPFSLTGTASGVRIDFDVLGFFRRGVAGCIGALCTDEGYFNGAFSSTFLGLTFAQVFARLDAGQDLTCEPGDVACTFDGNFSNATVPEPISLLTFGTGSALLALRMRKKKLANKQ